MSLDPTSRLKTEALVDVLYLFAKSSEFKIKILSDFGMQWILGIFKDTQVEILQKSVLRLVKLLVECGRATLLCQKIILINVYK